MTRPAAHPPGVRPFGADGSGPAWQPPTELDEYRLAGQLGAGAMGQVWLAHDRLLERAVAIKFIAAEEPSDEARERFLIEARAVARLQHPNVVAIYRVGAFAGLPFIVSELVRGVQLQGLPKPVGWERALELGIGLARGLAAAHRRGVLHRDLKPSNVMVAEDGTVKLLDFGLAKLNDAAARTPAPPFHAHGDHEGSARVTRRGAILGTPLYMAPEMWRGEPATPRSDVYSVGAILYELSAGRAPFDDVPLAELARATQVRDARPIDALVSGIDQAFAAVVMRALARDPTRRYPSGDALREALEQLAAPAVSAPVPEGNPYRGLLAFEREHRPLFFGRAAETRAVLDRLRAEPMVLVAADSGVGKTSLCRACVVPAIAAGALGPEPDVVSLVPGRRPLAALAAALAPLLSGEDGDESALLDTLGKDPARVGRALRRRARSLVLFVDQIEELVTVADAEEANGAAAALGALVLDAPGAKLLGTIRSDFLARFAGLPAIGDTLARALYVLPPLSSSGVREAVLGPARVKGFGFESDALVDELAESVGPFASGLPLLQFALVELWEGRDGERRLMTSAALDQLGGATGCLTRHADAVLAAMPPAQREAARNILLDLVTAEGTAAVRTKAELVGRAPAAEAALEVLVQGRLLVVRAADHGDEGWYSFAHEALLVRWDTLRGWLERDHEERLVHARIERAAAEWARIGKANEALWSDRQMEEAARVPAPALRGLEAEFLGASRSHAARRRVVRRALRLGAPSIAILALLPFAKVRYDTRQALELHRRLAHRATTEARERARESESLRSLAVARFDRGESDAEPSWAEALRAIAAADNAYAQAEHAWSRALDVAAASPELRGALADVLLEHVSLLERVDRDRDAEPVRAELAHFDDSGERRRSLQTPVRVLVSTEPAGAELSAERQKPLNGRFVAEPTRPLGTTPIAIDLAPGTTVLIVTSPNRLPVRYPLRIRTREERQVSFALPAEGEVPPGFVYVPPGRFEFGSSGDEGLRRFFFDAQPLHEVEIPGYYIMRREVTFGEWIRFLDALSEGEQKERMPSEHQSLNGVVLQHLPRGRWRFTLTASGLTHSALDGEAIRYGDRALRGEQDWRKFPVSGVSFDDARAYARWLDTTGQVPGARVCDDREWERAARGADARSFPQGDALGVDDANRDVTYGRQPGGFGPDEVGSHPGSQSPFGVDDLAGNVWEFTVSVDPDPRPVSRGGCWYMGDLSAQIPNRQSTTANHQDPLTGVRLCATPSRDALRRGP